MDPGEVLIVDDSPTSRMIIQRCIEMAGIAIPRYSQAENGLEALGMLKRQSSASAACAPAPGAAGAAGAAGLVVVTDINMPKMDGATFLRLLKADPAIAGVPVIVVSSIASSDEDAEYLGLGAAAVVKKPVSPAKMLQAFGSLA
jgi:two-component system chemotaxis response regulator CheY